MSLYEFIMSAGRHAMLLQCTNMYARTGHSNTKYNLFGLLTKVSSLRDTLWRFAKVSQYLTTQLSLIVTGLLIPDIACNA